MRCMFGGILSYYTIHPKPRITLGLNKCKLRQSHCKYDIRRHFFTYRIVAIWNSLPGYVVDAHNVNLFKNSLARHCCTLELFYDYDSELCGIGNRSFD